MSGRKSTRESLGLYTFWHPGTNQCKVESRELRWPEKVLSYLVFYAPRRFPTYAVHPSPRAMPSGMNPNGKSTTSSPLLAADPRTTNDAARPNRYNMFLEEQVLREKRKQGTGIVSNDVTSMPFLVAEPPDVVQHHD